MTYNCTCTRCGGTGEGVTVQQAKFSCHHKVGCGRKIGILEWTSGKTVTSTASTESIVVEAEAPTAAEQTTSLPEPTETPKPKKKKKKKVEE